MIKGMKWGGMLFASLLMASSCQNEEIITGEKQGNYSLTVSSLVDSRTYVKDDGTVVWSKGDKLYVYGNNVSGVLTLDDNDAGETEGTFSGFVFGNPDNLKWAVFGDNVKGTTNGAQFTISEITDPNSNSPMVGEIKNGNVDLKHLCGMVRITINNLPENADVKLTGDDIAGTAEWNGTSMSVKSASDEIAINVEKGSQTIEVPVFAGETEATKNFKLVVNGEECSFNAPIAIGALSEKAIMHITCITDENGNVTGFTQAATTKESLIQALQTEGTVSFQLSEDITLDAPIEVGANTIATIDLNGKTITGEFVKDSGAMIDNDAELTLIGGTIINTAINGDAVIYNSGTLVLDGVKIEGAPIADGGYPAYAVVSSGKLTIEDETYISSERGCLKCSGTGETVINGGTFTNKDIGSRSLTSHVVDVEDGGSHKLTINGGTFNHLHTNISGGVVICNRTTGTVYVNGGSFNGGSYYGNDNLSDYGYGGTFSVTGGTFSANPASKYLAEGYTATQNAENNTWTVSITEEKLNGLFQEVEDGGTITLAEGTITIPSSVANKNVTIEGVGDNTVIDFTKVNSVTNASITFKNLKIQGKNENVMSGFGIQGTTGHIAYEDCTFDGAVTNEYYGSVSYKNCTFTGTGYITTYAVKSATFENCVFDKADSRAVLVYSHGDNPVQVTLTDCDFYAAAQGKTGAGDWTAAVEIDTTNMPTSGTTVTITNCTYDEFYSGMVRDKSAAGKANAVITVDGKTISNN